MPNTITVPPEMGIALSTGRTEFIQMLRHRINNGDTLTKEHILGILDLAEQTVKDQLEIHRRIEYTKRRLADTVKNLHGASNMIEKLGDDFAKPMNSNPET